VSWILAFAGFAALIILHEAGHFTAAKAVGMRVERFFLFFPPKLLSIKRGETEYGIGMVPLGGFVKITGMNPEEELPEEIAERGYYHQPVWKRIVVIAAGPAVNIAIAFIILFALGFGLNETTDEVGETSAGTPAAALLESGDRLISIDGESVAGLEGDELRETVATRVNEHQCAGEPTDGCQAEEPVALVVERNGSPEEINVRPEYDAEVVALEGTGTGRMLIGFSYGTQPADVGVLGAGEFAADRMWFVTSRTMGVLARLFQAEQREQVSGVVGGFEVTRQSIEFDTRQALGVLAIISLSLGVINLFPFLPLDGGHIFWSIVEKVRGRPVPFRIMERSGVIGFMLVILIFLIGLTNDIGRLTGEGFMVR
jgi:regulator of sigma E protease